MTQNGDITSININDEIPLEKKKIHIKIKQRNRRKNITTIEGLADDLNIERIFKEMKRNFHCNGSIYDDNCIMLFGDQRIFAKKFLVSNSIAQESGIVMHGF